MVREEIRPGHFPLKKERGAGGEIIKWQSCLLISWTPRVVAREVVQSSLWQWRHHHLKVKHHFGVETSASDFIGRKYWPQMFFFQKINMADGSNNINKGHSKAILCCNTQAPPPHTHTRHPVPRSPHSWSYTFLVGSEWLLPWLTKLYSRQWVWEAAWRKNQRETLTQEDHGMVTSVVITWRSSQVNSDFSHRFRNH